MIVKDGLLKDIQVVENVQSENDGLQEPGDIETSNENGNLRSFNICIIILIFRIKKRVAKVTHSTILKKTETHKKTSTVNYINYRFKRFVS